MASATIFSPLKIIIEVIIEIPIAITIGDILKLPEIAFVIVFDWILEKPNT